MPTIDFCRERAAQCGRDAAASRLDNVRDQLLTAQGVWLDMADRIDRTNQARATLVAEKQQIAARGFLFDEA